MAVRDCRRTEAGVAGGQRRRRGYRPVFGFLPWLALLLRAFSLRLVVFFDMGSEL
jgi:hypothetical protein